MEKSVKNKLAIFLAVVMCVALAAGILVFVIPNNSTVCLDSEKLVALNSPAKKGIIKDAEKNSYMYFGLTENQKAHFINQQKSNKGTALKIEVEVLEGKKDIDASFAYGYLYEKDFQKKNQLKGLIEKRPLITGTFNPDEQKKFSAAKCVFENDETPQGFFIFTTVAMKIVSVEYTDAKTGFDREEKFFEFGTEGGKIDFNCMTYNYKACSKDYLKDNNKVLPGIQITLYPQTDIGSLKNQKKTKIKYGKENLFIRCSPVQNVYTLQTSAFKTPFEELSLIQSSELVKSVFMSANPVDEYVKNYPVTPLTSDFGMILNYPVENWRCREYELFSWESFPDVLIFDFAAYRIQDKFLSRLAFYTEKEEYKGKLVNDWVVDNIHGYNAHDYKPVDLAAFFNLAKKENFPLNEYECLLLEILLKNKIVKENTEGLYEPGKGAIVSISRESADYLRVQLGGHELWHGIYFTDEAFRKTVEEAYNSFDEKSMEFLKKYWSSQPNLLYDTTDDYLMKNEFMAYILQQSYPANIQKYFYQISENYNVKKRLPDLCKYVSNNKAKAFVETGGILNDYVFQRWGFAAGRLNMISR